MHDITEEQIEKAEFIFTASEFQGDIRVGLLMARNSGSILLKHIENLKEQNSLLRMEINDLHATINWMRKQ